MTPENIVILYCSHNTHIIIHQVVTDLGAIIKNTKYNGEKRVLTWQ